MASDRTVVRFSRSERALHWLSAGAFGALLATGLILWLPILATQVNDRPLVKRIHLVSAIALGIGTVAIVLLGDRRGILASARQVDRFDADDRAWVTGLPRRLRRGGEAPPAGRFNAGQKLNVVVTAASWILFGVSGLFLWLGERNTTLRLDGMLFLHDVLTLTMLAVVCGHLYMVFLNPRTAGSLPAMVRGRVPERWARRHHPKWDP